MIKACSPLKPLPLARLATAGAVTDDPLNDGQVAAELLAVTRPTQSPATVPGSMTMLDSARRASGARGGTDRPDAPGLLCRHAGLELQMIANRSTALSGGRSPMRRARLLIRLLPSPLQAAERLLSSAADTAFVLEKIQQAARSLAVDLPANEDLARHLSEGEMS